MLDDDLLSHGETPHYHRRCTVSLLSSERDQVVPVLYGRQAIRLDIRIAYVYPNWVCDWYYEFNKLSALFRLPLQSQIAWVLYGQASRAISTG